MIEFNAFGHENILATHNKTVEFTKDKDLTKKGDCIIGVNSDFDDLSDALNHEKIKIVISLDEFCEEIECWTNKEFRSNEELVVRKSDFSSERTLGIFADKAAIDLDRQMVEKMKDPGQKINVKIIPV